MVISQGDVWWEICQCLRDQRRDTAGPLCSFRVTRSSAIRSVVCVPVTGNLKWATTPGNVVLRAPQTGLERDSVANVSQVTTLDRSALTERVGKLSQSKLDLVLAGLDVVLGR